MRSQKFSRRMSYPFRPKISKTFVYVMHRYKTISRDLHFKEKRDFGRLLRIGLLLTIGLFSLSEKIILSVVTEIQLYFFVGTWIHKNVTVTLLSKKSF